MVHMKMGIGNGPPFSKIGTAVFFFFIKKNMKNGTHENGYRKWPPIF
jgi:hypothetical protein